jgi:hypothetical protein
MITSTTSGVLTIDSSTFEELHERLYDAGRKIDARQRVIRQARAMAEVIRGDSADTTSIDKLIAILDKSE